MRIANLGTRKLGYVWVSYRVLERNFYELAKSNGVEQYSEQSSKPLSQQSILRKAKMLIYHCCIVSEQPSNLLKRFLLVTLHRLHEWYIDIYTQRTTKLFTPMIKSFVALKVLIQNERTRWFTVQTLSIAFVQGTVRVGYSPLFFYYELLKILSLIQVECSCAQQSTQ